MKTIEEAAKEYSASREDNDYTIETEMAFNAGVAFAQQWISVEEEMPIEPSKYLVKRYNEIEFCEWKIKGKSKDGYWYDYLGITHWRPIERK